MGVSFNNESTTAKPPPENGHQPKPVRGLNAFNWCQHFTSVVQINCCERIEGALNSTSWSKRNLLVESHYITDTNPLMNFSVILSLKP